MLGNDGVNYCSLPAYFHYHGYMTLKKTPLNGEHHKLQGRMVPFAGWEMPVQYSSIVNEHQAVREKAGVFDVSHMGEISIEGPEATAFLDSITCNNVTGMDPGMVRYNAIPNFEGGLIDDLTIYCISNELYFLVVNASNTEAVYQHIQKELKGNVRAENQSDSWHQIAVQGPEASSITESLLQQDLTSIQYYRFSDIDFKGNTLRISRTGYTGEDGFEIYSAIDTGIDLWNKLLHEYNVIPCGLGSRDSLRLEARMPLYGHELSETMTPSESGIGWIVKEKAIPYPGYDRIINDKKNGVSSRIAGFELQGGGVPREDYPVHFNGKEVGKVKSGGYSPVLKKGIGTTFLPIEIIEASEGLQIDMRGRLVPAAIVKGPFVKGTAGSR